MRPRRPTTALVRYRVGVQREGIDLHTLAREAGVHPELAARLVRLGLLEPIDGASRRYPRDAAATLARAVRLMHDLGLNYAGAVLASQLLVRIDELEARLRAQENDERRTR
jgi:chaperone modulatory protein CbpM